MIKCRKNGFKTGEVPVISKNRKSGKSSVKWFTALEFFMNIVKYRLGIIK
jgi:hypothetical protein